MKKILAFLLLLCICAVFFCLPADPVPAHPIHPLPLRAIFGYLGAVAAGGWMAFTLRRTVDTAEAPENR